MLTNHNYRKKIIPDTAHFNGAISGIIFFSQPS